MHIKGDEGGDGSGVMTGNEIVISGISGKFPMSNNVTEFMENLYNQTNMVIEVRPEVQIPDYPIYRGKIGEVDKFDATFFKVTYQQVLSMDPQCRELMGYAYAAVYDSGINPLEMTNKKVGVFIASSGVGDKPLLSNEYKSGITALNKFFISGSSKAMYANRISYWFNSKGPSCYVDCSCTGSLAIMDLACRSLLDGDCESALVGGCSLCFGTYVTMNLKNAGLVCSDGKTKCFDNRADGYARSEAVGVVFLQKARDAKRIYAEVYHTKFGFGDTQLRDIEHLRHSSSKGVVEFLNKFYSETDVSPHEVEFIEANGIAIAEDDKNELEAIDEVFGNKVKPVKIGCVKSNMGNSESASGFCALTKVCLAYITGKLAGNLHYESPHDLDAVQDGRIEVVQGNIPFNRGFVALNSISYTGPIAHVLLKGHYIKKKNYKSNIPYLINVSSRNVDGVGKMLDILAATPIDAEYIGLLHDVHKTETPGHTTRGYIILEPNHEDINNKPRVLCKRNEYFKGVKPPVCFMYSGMGSQWCQMGADLMKVPIFSAAIEKCHKILEPHGVDLINILTTNDQTIFDNVINSFIGITAVQIGMTDILRALEVVPDYIIGHSTGEVGCAYADGCFTLEETILSAYYRGVASKQTKVIRGAMAAVGMGYEELKRICPDDVVIACHNSDKSSTLSGPVDALRDFVASLTKRGIFAKEVPCANIAYHSKYIKAIGTPLFEGLKGVIKTPKKRSSKWLSTSFLQNRWDEGIAAYASAEYFTNNLLSPVYFEETSKLIPSGAVVIEIAPHGLLQAIVKRSHESCVHIPLAKRAHENPTIFLLDAIGRLYQNGLNPRVSALYPRIEYPVSTETPLLSNLVFWEHGENWPVSSEVKKVQIHEQVNNFYISLYDEDKKAIEGYSRNGVNVIPEAQLLVLVWKTLAMSRNVDYNELSVKFNNVYFNSEVAFGENKFVKIKVSIIKGSNKFEVSSNEVIVATGVVNDDFEQPYLKVTKEKTENDILLTSDEIYRLLSLRGHLFNKEFQTIRSANTSISKAIVEWTGEWISYIDGIIQLQILKRNHNGISTPKLIRELVIDVDNHHFIKTVAHDAVILDLYDTVRCGGVTIKDVVFSERPVVPAQEPSVVLTEKFWPHFLEDDNTPLETGVQVQLQIIAENSSKNDINILELKTTKQNLGTLKDVVHNTGSFNWTTVDINDGGLRDYLLSSYEKNKEKFDALVIHGTTNNENLRILHDTIRNDTFVLVVENKKFEKDIYKQFCIVSAMGVDGYKLLLLKKCSQEFDEVDNLDVIKPSVDFQHTEEMFVDENERKDAKKRSIVVCKSKNEIYKYSLKSKSNATNMMIIEDEEAEFSVKDNFYKDQLKKNLIVNTLKYGQWGGHYYTSVCARHDAGEFKVTMKTPHDFESVSFEQIATSKLHPNKTIKVYYAGISQRDCQQPIFAKQSVSLGLGMDFSGKDVNGDHVMGLLEQGALASSVTADTELVWPVPRHWTLQEAATVPLPYVHAYYTLSKVNLIRGDRVLVIGGAGALGQALISICLSLGCIVYTSVSTLPKKEPLLNLFPNLKENNILCDQNDEFLYNYIATQTENNFCKVVISCTSGRLREVAMKCVGFMGSFLDVNQHDMESNKSFGMSYMWQCRSYKMVNLSSLFERNIVQEKKAIKFMIAEGISNGVVKPLPSITYDIEDVPKALKFLSSRNNIGRVIIKMNSPSKNNVVPRISCSSTATYVVVCEEDILSLELIEILISRGARNITVLWNGPTTAYLQYKIGMLKKSHSTVNVLVKNVINEKECTDAIKEAEEVGSVDGVFLIVGKESNRSLSPVMTSLDFATRSLCKNLSYFVVVCESSQNIYDKNIYLQAEKICKERQTVGLPGLALETEISNEVFEHSNSKNNIVAETIPKVLNALETSINLKYHNIKAVIGNYGDSTQRKENDPKTSVAPKTVDEGVRKVEVKVTDISAISSKDNKCKGNTKLKQNKGLGIFYSHIEVNVEEVLRYPLVTMSTKALKCFESKFEIDPTKSHLILIPGFEGHQGIFNAVCEPLKIRAVAMKLEKCFDDSSIQEMALNMYKLLAKTFDIKKKFYLLGYSFGVNVALELAALIEKQGAHGVVYCLDSSPDALRHLIKRYAGDLSNVNLQNKIVAHMLHLVTGLDSEEFLTELDNIGSWYKKIDFFLNRVKGLVSYPHEYMTSLLESTYDRFVTAMEYQPNLKLRSELVLIKSTTSAEIINLPDDYNLGQYSESPVKIYNIDGDHASVPYHIRVSSIINESLDIKLLDEFNKTNTCETYLIYT